jgi:pilus assembly protein Flp/PilA
MLICHNKRFRGRPGVSLKTHCKRCDGRVVTFYSAGLCLQIVTDSSGVQLREMLTEISVNHFKQIRKFRRNSGYGLPNASTTMEAASLRRSIPTHLKGFEMKNLMMRLWKEEEGQDLTEYALLLTLIALATVTAIKGLAGSISTIFGNANTTLST